MSDPRNPYQGSFDGSYQGDVSFGDSTPAASAPEQAGQPSAPQQPATGLDLGLGGPPPADLIKDTTTAEFTADVIQASRNGPVLVDFWAPWCGPCKQLTPVLEKAVGDAKGAVRLVKLNIDDHPAIPGQMGVQSIPAVIAFVNGQPVDGFMGAKPESEVKAFINKLAKAGGGDSASPVEEALTAGKAALEAGDVSGAANLFAAVLSHEPENAAARGGMAQSMIALGQTDQARQILAECDETAAQHPDVAAAMARIELMDKVAALGDPAELQRRLTDNPDDHQARLDLALIHNAQDEKSEAVDQLVAIMKKDREWNEEAARKQLLTFFEAWGPTDPATLAGRRKLSSLLFS